MVHGECEEYASESMVTSASNALVSESGARVSVRGAWSGLRIMGENEW